MYILSQTTQFQGLAAGEKTFLEAWFNLTHAQSLDSFRVRCHNGRTILEELRREMRYSFAGPEDLGPIASEAKSICSYDVIIQSILGGCYAVLATLLPLIEAKPKDESVYNKAKEQLGFLLDDFLPAVPDLYLARTFKAIEPAIAGNDEAAIISLASLLATDLAARGWAVASLHAWIQTRFLGASAATATFAHRFADFTDRMKRPPEPYEVVVQIAGSRGLQPLGEFAGFIFSPSPPAVDAADAGAAQSLEKFVRGNPLRTFASTTVQAVDQNSAIHAALDKLAHCQDRLRFSYAREPVMSLTAFLVTRQADRKRRIVHAAFRVPNPEHHLELPAFLAANRRIDSLLASERVPLESQRRIQSALRHYRLGLDGRAYPDKLLNWWMGLETLTSGGDGKNVGAKVIRNSSPLVSHRYFTVQLAYLESICRSTCDKWPSELQSSLRIAERSRLSWRRMLAVLQDTTLANSLGALMAGHPWALVRWNRFRELANDPAKLAAYLDEHDRNVRWHLHRLYRIRCCLVHGTPVVAPLQLPTANLEYYLRECIYVAIGAFSRSSNISSLEELFDRAHYCHSRRREILLDRNAKPPAIRQALDSDFTFRPPASP